MLMETVSPVKGVEFFDLGIYLREHQTLILADFHIGQEEALVRQGVLIPKFHFRDLVKGIESILSQLKTSKRTVRYIVINGDLKHEFGTISDEEWRNTLKIIDFLGRNCDEIILTRGNHDSILGPIADKRKVRFVDHLILDDILICHGNTIPPIPEGVRTIITAHEHPAITLTDELRQENFKCFLVGKYKGEDRKSRQLIVQPAMNPLSQGTDVLTHRPLSKFLQASNINGFDVYIVQDKIYPFGKLGRLDR